MTERWRDASVALGIVAISLLVHAPLLDVPFERDEGGYAYIAWRLTLGEVPYLDWFELKPPGIFWAYRLALALPWDPVVAVHAVAAGVSAATAVALFFLARRLLARGAAIVSALLYVWISADPHAQGSSANTEIFMMLPVVLATLVLLDTARADRTRALPSLAVGALVGVAVAFKQVGVVYVPCFLVLHYLIADGEQRGRRLGHFALWASAGGLLVWAGILGWFHARGGLGALFDATLFHNLAYAGSLSIGRRFGNLIGALDRLFRSQGLVWVLAAIGFVALRRSGQRWRALSIEWLALFSALGVCASGWFFPHYFQQLLPAVALAAGAGAQALVDARSWADRSPRTRAFLVGAAALAPMLLYSASFWRLSPEDAVRRIYPTDSFDVMPELARQLAAVTEPDDEVFHFGADPEVLFYAKRRSASRYIFIVHVYGPYDDLKALQQEVEQEVRKKRPAAVVGIPHGFMSGDPNRNLTGWVKQYTDRHYHVRSVASIDAEGRRHLRTSDDGAPIVPAGERPFAALYLRNE